MPGRKVLRRLLRPLRKALRPGAVVLGYHRIADLHWDPLELAVSAGNFSEQVDVLSSKLTVVSLPELARRQRNGQKLDGLAAVTFDDGYADFLESALPLLSRAEVPATIFIATGCTGHSFWWEELAALLCASQRSVESIRVTLDCGPHGIVHTSLSDEASCQRAVRDLCHQLRGADHSTIASVLTQLRKQIASAGAAEPEGRPLTSAELKRLSALDFVDVGGHTVDHGCLGELSPTAQRQQIEKCQENLEDAIGRRAVSFSYPNGSLSVETPRLVAECGFLQGCTSEEGTFGPAADPFTVPRLWAPNVGGAGFERWLSQWSRWKP